MRNPARPLVAIARSYLTGYGGPWKALQWVRPRTVSDLEAVFVVGCPRSGTTLVQRILSNHEAFFSIDAETGLFTWRNPLDRRHFKLDWDETRALFDASEDVVDFFERAVVRVGRERGGETFVEKTPSHVLRLGFLMSRFPRSRFVHVLRDGRDAYASSKAHLHVPQRRSARAFARYWRRCVAAAGRVEQRESVLTVRYERLVTAPVEEVERLMAFLGRTAREAQLDPDRIAEDPRGGRDVFRRLREGITDASVGRWRGDLTDAEKAAFWRVAGRRLAALGYPER